MSNIEKKIYLHHNYNKNQIKQVLLENSDYDTISTPTSGEDKGLIYYDTLLNRVSVWNGSDWKILKYLDDQSGSDPKESVVAIAAENINLYGTQSLDGYLLSIGHRVLAISQTSSVDNGIYDVSATTWSRSADANGDTSGEVSIGNFTFVERGLSYSATGWILYESSATGSTISVGVDTQLWTQFNGAANFNWGNGLTSNGDVINVLLAKGVTFSGDYLYSDADTINTTAYLPNLNIATNSTLQNTLSSIDTYLLNIVSQQEISISNNPIGTFIKSINSPQNILGYTFSIASDGYPHIYINGLHVKTNSATTSAAYFSTDNGTTGTYAVISNSILFINPFVLDYNIDATDEIIVQYLTKTI